MDKGNWTYKQFEDCIEKVKHTTKLQTSDYQSYGEYPIISQEDEMISGYWDKKEDVFNVIKPIVVFGDHTRVLKYVDFDFVLGADGVKILQPIDALNAKFLFYYLKWSNIPSLGYSRHYKLLKEISVPVPPLPIQQRIVAELDCISGILEKKRQQLKELDNLTQAIFYDMFGDPVENEKGWEVKKLGEECLEIRYGTSKPAVENGKYGYLRMGNLTSSGHLDLSDLKTIDIPDDEIEKCIVRKGDILFNRTNSLELIGKTCMFDLEEPMVIAGYIIRVRLKSTLHPRFVAVLFNLPSMKKTLRKMAKGAVNQANINSKELASIPIILPPLSLQQSFAAKIEAIEKQKERISQSIKEVQTLFDSRMEEYFG